jgi:hypothetical protein
MILTRIKVHEPSRQGLKDFSSRQSSAFSRGFTRSWRTFRVALAPQACVSVQVPN